jgi:hypothetical protein
LRGHLPSASLVLGPRRRCVRARDLPRSRDARQEGALGRRYQVEAPDARSAPRGDGGHGARRPPWDDMRHRSL